tara:strand:+ start:1107 stop:1694 length:588 start_codon:yes stop_codon:yes gene_type:complete
MDTIYNYLLEKGFSKEAAAGIMGNIDVETGGSYDYQQKQKGGGKGYGLFQFDFMNKYYQDYLKRNKLEDSANTQIDYMYDTIYGNEAMFSTKDKKALREALESGNVQQATKGFQDIFENPGVPHEDRRMKSAEDIYKKYNKPTEETSMMAPTNMKEQRIVNTRKMISKEVAKDFNILNVMDDLGQTFQIFKEEDM